MNKSIYKRAVLGAAMIAAVLPFAAANADESNAMICRVIGNMSIVFKAETSEREIQQVLNQAAPYAFEEGDYQPGARWSSTSYGSTGSIGNPARLGYSYVPDGVFVPNASLGSGPNSLFARMNALFGGNTALWQSKVGQAFERWGQLSGLIYAQTSDDGASLHSAPGAQNVRGDVRISMITLTNGNVIAYNFFPNNGDMVMNRSYNWNNANQDYRFIRNVIGHEHGHGIGLNHVGPVNNSKLLEPFLSTAFDGPQSDDIQGAQYLYGDVYENNDNNAQKSDLGSVSNGQLIDYLAIERNSDTDWFRVAIPPGNSLGVTITPVGHTYLQGPEGGPYNSRNSLRIHDLRLTIYQMDGTTLIQTVNANGLGLGETISGIARPSSGEVTVKVDSITVSGDIQRYRMNFNLAAANVVVVPDLFTLTRGSVFSGNLASLSASDNSRLVLRPGVTLSQSQAPIVYVVEADSPELNPSHLTFGIEGSMSASTGQRVIELYNFDTSAYETVSTAAMNTTEALTEIDIATNPGRFIAGDGTVRARISHRVTGPVLSFPWSSSTDHIYWELTP